MQILRSVRQRISIADALFAILLISNRSPAQTKSYAVTDLGTMGRVSSSAADINERGQVVGSANDNSGIPRAFLWGADVMVDLGTLGGNKSTANAINDLGQVTGGAALTNGRSRAFLWENGKLLDLGTLGGDTSSGVDINNEGTVVGFSESNNGEFHAFRWEHETGMLDLGTLGGSTSQASAINDLGHVVGHSNLRTTDFHAFVWDPISGLRDLGTLVGTALSQADDINNRHQIVGTTVDHRRAVLWEQGVILDLNQRLTRGSPWTLEHAYAINDTGQVLVLGVHSDGTHHPLLMHGSDVIDLSLRVPQSLGHESLFPRTINNEGWIVGTARIADEFHAVLLTPCFDADDDGVCNDDDNCLTTPNHDQFDRDLDDVGDACDGCPIDPFKTLPGICGCGAAERVDDDDADGIPNCLDVCPGQPDDLVDADADGIMDCVDDCRGTLPNVLVDIHGCESSDCNNNQIADSDDIRVGRSADCNRNGIPDECDLRDGTQGDCNDDGTPDACERDCDQNGIPDVCEIEMSTGQPTNDDETTIACPRIWFVNPRASGRRDGQSWNDAFTVLQPGLFVAHAGDEIWVASGTYTPVIRTDLDDPRSVTFSLKDGVAIYGGFRGDEEHREQRDPADNRTILSGDVDGNDLPVFEPTICRAEQTRAENAYHVVTADGLFNVFTGPLLLDGFTIQKGQADGESHDLQLGGGLFMRGVSLTLRNCTLKANAARSGGGIWTGGDARLNAYNCAVYGNAAESGGGIQQYVVASMRLEKCTIRDNFAQDGEGGGIELEFSSATLIDSLFHGNHGAGVHIDFHKDGGIHATNCRFTGNIGGGVRGGDPTLVNCVVVGNAGVGVTSSSKSDVTLVNSIIVENDLLGFGGGGELGNSEVTNSIVWGNGSQGNEEPCFLCRLDSINYTCIQGGWTGGGGEGIIDLDPQFVRYPDDGGDGWGVGDNDDFGDLRLRPTSPCIDAGANMAVPNDITRDLAGKARFRNDPCTPDTGQGEAPIVDIGAYEFSRDGDADCDDDRDLADLLGFVGCMSGADVPAEARCAVFDIDGDEDVDLADFVAFQAAFTGAR